MSSYEYKSVNFEFGACCNGTGSLFGWGYGDISSYIATWPGHGYGQKEQDPQKFWEEEYRKPMENALKECLNN